MNRTDEALQAVKDRQRRAEQQRVRARRLSRVTGLLTRVARFPGGDMTLPAFCREWTPLWLEAAREVRKHGLKTTRGFALPEDELVVVGQELFEKALDGDRRRFADELLRVCRQLGGGAGDRWRLCQFFDSLAVCLRERETRNHQDIRTYTTGETYAKLCASGLWGVSRDAFRKWPGNLKKHKPRRKFKARIMQAWREDLRALDRDAVDEICCYMESRIAELCSTGMSRREATKELGGGEFRT